ITSVPGDMNGDYKLNATDILAFSQHMLGIKNIDGIATKGDLNADGVVDSTDLTVLKMQILGLSA
ncbi:MAG: dockerin type I repeat-containing protein, partial [Clostridia bacterium]|nr:dockerin type I repeat-containing protein [Clostridia bacterium]